MNKAKRPIRMTLLWLVVIAVAGAARGDQTTTSFFGSRVVDYSPGDGNAYFPDPQWALGGPYGTPDGSLHVVTLGVQGVLVLGFEPGQALTDAEGDDLIVFENPFAPLAGGVFAELVRVGVSSDGMNYAFFPTTCTVPGPIGPYGTIDPSWADGFAGLQPVEANVAPIEQGGNLIDPFDPDVAGGDDFDLADLADDPLVVAGDVDLTRIYYVKLVDVLGDGSEQDSWGNPIYDPEGEMAYPFSGPVSADIDAISVIHGLGAPLAGDANRDGAVDYVDLGLLATDYDRTVGMLWENGDFNADGGVDYADLGILATNYGTDGGSGGTAHLPADGGQVPEPVSIILWLSGAAVGIGRRKAFRGRKRISPLGGARVRHTYPRPRPLLKQP